MTTANQNFRLIEDIAIAAAVYRFVDRIEGFVETVTTTAATWAQRERNRRFLSQMDDRLLNDIGLTRFDIEGETNKHFWEK